MPFTLAHPAAVLPLRRFARLSFSGLVIGAMTPDFGYYLLLPELRTQTHSLAGSFETCLPVGLLLALLFQWLRLPLCGLLPQPHRGALLALARRRPGWTAASLLRLAASVLLGIWTHLLWDACTHKLSWGPQHLAVLRLELFSAAGTAYWLSDALQWLSSLTGLAVLAAAYRRWLGQQPVAAVDAAVERRRWRRLLGLAALAVLAALPCAWITGAPYHQLRVYAFQAWVHAASFFLLLSAGLALLHRHDGRAAPATPSARSSGAPSRAARPPPSRSTPGSTRRY